MNPEVCLSCDSFSVSEEHRLGLCRMPFSVSGSDVFLMIRSMSLGEEENRCVIFVTSSQQQTSTMTSLWMVISIFWWSFFHIYLFIYLNNPLLLKALHMYLPRSSLSPILILSSPPPSPILVPGPHSPIVCVHGPCMMILPLKFAFRILTMPVHCCYHKLSLIYINSVTLNLGTFKRNSLPRHRMLSNHLILFVI